MLIYLKKWIENIIVITIICTIIEILIPEGNNKKYIRVVSGIYIIYAVLTPVLQIFDFSYNNIFYQENIIQTYSKATYQIKNEEIEKMYFVGLEENIKNDIENLGYKVKNANVTIDSKYENIENIEIEFEEMFNKLEEQEYEEYNDIFELLEEKYFVSYENIKFK